MALIRAAEYGRRSVERNVQIDDIVSRAKTAPGAPIPAFVYSSRLPRAPSTPSNTGGRRSLTGRTSESVMRMGT